MQKSSQEAFRWLDREFENAAFYGVLHQEEAHDWIYMMQDDDWAALEKAWTKRDLGWKLECAFLLGLGPIEGQELLKRAIFDDSPEVMTEAAIALSRLVVDYAQEVKLDQNILGRMQEVVELRLQEAVKEVEEVIKQTRI